MEPNVRLPQPLTILILPGRSLNDVSNAASITALTGEYNNAPTFPYLL